MRDLKAEYIAGLIDALRHTDEEDNVLEVSNQDLKDYYKAYYDEALALLDYLIDEVDGVDEIAVEQALHPETDAMPLDQWLES